MLRRSVKNIAANSMLVPLPSVTGSSLYDVSAYDGGSNSRDLPVEGPDKIPAKPSVASND